MDNNKLNENAIYPEILIYPNDSTKIEELRNRSSIMIHDTIIEQLKDLYKCLNPKINAVNSTEFENFKTNKLQNKCEKEYGVWVYYPWNQRLVHLLPEEDFIFLRTNRNNYKITPEEQNELKNKKIGIVGLSVGFSVALALGLERSFGELRLADYDSLDLSNLNRLPTAVHNLGVSKVVMAARALFELDPYLNISIFQDGLNENNIDAFFCESGKLDLIIDECDSFDIKVLLRTEAQRLGVPVIMETSDRGLIDVERFDLEPNRALLHGRLKEIDPKKLKNLSMEQKTAILTQFTDIESLAPRTKASLLEVEQSIRGWPQLGSAVMHGGGAVADTSRRILLNQAEQSGRFYVDFEELIMAKSKIEKTQINHEVKTPTRNPPLQTAIELLKKEIAKQPTINSNTTQSNTKIETIKQLIEDANLAPSGANCQPWHWIYANSQLYLLRNRQRGESFLNYNGRLDWVALGAATETLLISAKSKSINIKLDFKPFPHIDDIACVFTFDANSNNTTSDASLYNFISKRATQRNKINREIIPLSILNNIQNSIVEYKNVKLTFYNDLEMQKNLARMMGEADRIRLCGQQTHSQLISEFRWSKEESLKNKDGFAIETMELSTSEEIGLRFLKNWDVIQHLNTIKKGAALKKISEKQVIQSSGIGIITIKPGSDFEYFNAGRAMQKSWLASVKENVSWHPMTALPYLIHRYEMGTYNEFEKHQVEMLKNLQQEYRKVIPQQSNSEEIFLFRYLPTLELKNRSYRISTEENFDII